MSNWTRQPAEFKHRPLLRVYPTMTSGNTMANYSFCVDSRIVMWGRCRIDRIPDLVGLALNMNSADTRTTG